MTITAFLRRDFIEATDLPRDAGLVFYEGRHSWASLQRHETASGAAWYTVTLTEQLRPNEPARRERTLTAAEIFQLSAMLEAEGIRP